MVLRLYIARLKCIYRNKSSMFWNYMFPLILATCFFLAFNNVMTTQSFETISIAYVSEIEGKDDFEEILTEVSYGDKKMFEVTYAKESEAKKLLEDGKIEAYIVNRSEPELYINQNGINETIIKAFLDTFRQKYFAIEAIMSQNPKAIEQGLLDDVLDYRSFVEEVKGQKKPDMVLVYYYSLLAYTCVFATNWGLEEVINIQADQSHKGARINVSPIHKMKLFFINLTASFTAHIGSLILLFSYMYFVLKLNFGINLPHLFFICLLGTLTGLSMGATIGIWVKKKAEVKEAIMTVVVLFSGFLSGMMLADMKYLVAKYVPIIQYLNPCTLITDAMYSLYYYDSYNRYYLSAALLCMITLLLSIASYVGMRRKNYASI